MLLNFRGKVLVQKLWRLSRSGISAGVVSR